METLLTCQCLVVWGSPILIWGHKINRGKKKQFEKKKMSVLKLFKMPNNNIQSNTNELY